MRLGKRALPVLAILVVLTAAGAAVILRANGRNEASRAHGPLAADALPPTLKIIATEPGVYAISTKTLLSFGVDPVEHGYDDLQLSHRGRDVPYLLHDGLFVFYVGSNANRYTKDSVYMLRPGLPGRSISEERLQSDPDLPPIRRVTTTARWEKNLLYDGRARPSLVSDAAAFEPWYWATIHVDDSFAVELPILLGREPVGAANLTLALWGASHSDSASPDHDLDVHLNGESLGVVRWDGASYTVDQLALSAGLLRVGENRLVLDNTGPGAVPIDIMRLDWIELNFQMEAIATDDAALVSDASGLLQVGGFSAEPLALDIANPQEPVLLTGWSHDEGTVQIPVADDMKVVLAGPLGMREPAVVRLTSSSSLRDTANQADFIVIADAEFNDALAPLVHDRESQGMKVVTAQLNEIADEFGNGQYDPSSITAFLRYARESWAPPAPQYLLLVGDTTYDYRGYLGETDDAWIPAPMVSVNYSGETISDSRLADLDGDLKPDLAVGRWPVSDLEDVSSLVKRTLAYEAGRAADTALFAADGSSAEFAAFNDRLIAASGFGGSELNRLYGAGPAEFSQAWNEGAWLVSYAGHGSLDRWGRDDVFSGAEVPGLQSNANPPLVLQLTCLTGYFAHPTESSLAETMLLHDGGPVAIVAATSLTLSSSQEPFGTELLKALTDPTIIRVGDALQQAKLALDVAGNDNLREIVDTFGLLGDPTTRLTRP